MLIVVTVLFSDVIPLRERGTYQGYLNLIGAAGSTSGGPIGEILPRCVGVTQISRLIKIFQEVYLCKALVGDGTTRPCALS